MGVDQDVTAFDRQARELAFSMWAVMTYRQHTPRESDEGYTCDEMGCSICNASEDEWTSYVAEAYAAGTWPEAPSDEEILDAAQEFYDDYVADKL